MARQQFERGQTVYVHRYSGRWQKAIVADPDIVKMSPGWHGKKRAINYVGVNYVDMVGVDRQWDILNNRLRIITEEENAKLDRAKDIGKLHQIIADYRAFETNFAKYVEQARIILEEQVTKAGLDDIDELAHYLRGTFSFRGDYSRLTRGEVRKVRADKRTEAQAAQVTLQVLGEPPPELP
jgi:hypothetical protein